MAILAILKENASAIAAIFSVLGVLIGYGNYRLNVAQTAFQMGTDPIFEPGVEPVENAPGWWHVTMVVRNRAPATLVVQSVTVPRWGRCRLLAARGGEDDRELAIDRAGKRLEFGTEVLPVGNADEIFGRTWRSDTSTIEFFLYCPAPPCRLRAIWRSKSSTRLRRSKIVV